MTDREKVIEGLEMSFRYSNVDESNTLVPQQLVLDVIALLKAQKPLEPTIGRAVEHDGHDSWWYQCGKCKKPIDWQDNYCRNCGRAVKWDA